MHKSEQTKNRTIEPAAQAPTKHIIIIIIIIIIIMHDIIISTS